MQIFVTGATGWIGSAVIDDLIQAGHRVTGLVRTPDAVTSLEQQGGDFVVGSLDDLVLLRAAVDDVDAIVHTAMESGFTDQEKAIRDDVRAIEAFGEVFSGSDRPIIVTHGLGTLPAGEVFTEDARPGIIPDYPRASEQAAFRLADRGLSASVVRPARSVHGMGERHGFVPLFAKIARERGSSAFVDDGDAPWPACHRRDVARLYRLAVERGMGGEAYHAVSETVPFRQVAEAIGRQLHLPVEPIQAADAGGHFGELALWVVGGGEVATALTRERLGWHPTEIGLIQDIDRPDYFKGSIGED